jgi:hypothetical protein
VAKEWVEENSCPAWRDGWLMVDGTLVPLAWRPGFFGNVFFDHKCNYSMNVQVCSSIYLKMSIIWWHSNISLANINPWPVYHRLWGWSSW